MKKSICPLLVLISKCTYVLIDIDVFMIFPININGDIFKIVCIHIKGEYLLAFTCIF